MEIKIQSTQFIKPSNPTPENRRHFKLSALDQLAPPSSYMFNVILYYKTSGEVDVSDKSGQLVNSLSDVLNLYYPLAGRITQDGFEVDCSDQGVKYLKTRVSVRLDDFLGHGPKIDHVGQLISAPDLATNALLIVQANVFDCGSLVIGVSASHKVTDAYNLVRFINAWASVNRTGRSNAAYCPFF
ncbi:putative salutaridinol 7-O-acetyltransferase [Helianthus debilis subsp. tardiflorus]